MKSGAWPDGFPTNTDTWEKLIADTPEGVHDPDCPYDPNDPKAVEAYWSDPVVVREGSIAAVRASLRNRKRPAKVSVTVPYSPEVLDYFQTTGEGWQARMDAALREYVAQHPA